jgi:hypothetical protein
MRMSGAMSTHRELVNAQQRLNEAVDRLLPKSWSVRDLAVELGDLIDTPDFMTNPNRNEGTIDCVEMVLERHFGDLVAAHAEFDALRKQFDGDRPAPPVYTSIRAAKRPPFVTGSQAHTVLIAILAHWKLHGVGLTSDYLEGRLRKPHQTVSARINGLMKKGWIKDSGERAATRSGDLAIRWVPTEMALQWDADQHMPEAAT